MQPENRPSLHEMVGLGDDASADELRWAYEQAMSRATRSGDHKRAMALSRAFDELSAHQRSQVYDKSTALGRAAGVAPPAGRRRSTTVGAPSAPGRPRRSNAVMQRVLVYGIVASVVVIGVVLTVQHRNDARPTYQPPVQPVPVAPTVPAVLEVPMDAPTGANGLVSVVCEPDSGVGGYSIEAQRGSVVSCSNGAIPIVLSDAGTP